MNRLQYFLYDLKYRGRRFFTNEFRPKGHLYARHFAILPDGTRKLLQMREAWGVVTDDFVEYLVDNLIAELAAFGDFKYHDSGTGVVAEDVTDAGLGTPCGEARDVGTQVESSSKVYKSVATNTYAGAFAITEHGLFNNAAGGILMDRTVFAAINVVATNQIEFTYELTCPSGG